MNDCDTCELVRRRDRADAPPWDVIRRTDYFDVAHAYNTSLPGWTVIVARRHVEAIDDLSAEEGMELGPVIHGISKGLKESVGCAKTYVMQFAEADGHHHVHFHVVPRMAELPDEYVGPDIFHYLSVDFEHRVPESRMNEIAFVIQKHLQH